MSVEAPANIVDDLAPAFNERFEEFKLDMLRVCDRIATDRELFLKKQLKEAVMQNNAIQLEIQNLTKLLEDGNSDRRVRDLSPNVRESLKNSLEETKETLAVEHRAKSEGWTLWQEWQETVNELIEEEQNMDIENFQISAWGHDKIPVTRASRCTVNPNKWPCILWECLGIPLLFYDVVTIPMQVFYSFPGMLFNIIGWITTLYWSFDIFLRLFVIGSVTNEGVIKLQRRVLMKRYLRSSFLFDVCMVAPDWFSKALGAASMRNVAVLRLVRLVRFLRLLRMSKMKNLWRQLEDLVDSEYFTVAVSISNNLLAILGTCHYCGCFWFAVGSMEVPGGASWIDSSTIRDAEWQDQYVVSLHWAIAQFTPGASRIQPENSLEGIAGIAVLVCGLIYMSLFISALSQARMRLQAITSKIDRDNWMLRRYLRQIGVAGELQARTMKYVEKCLEPMLTRVQRKDVTLIPLLSRPLQLEIQEQQYFHTLIRHPLLRTFRERSLALTLRLFSTAITETLLADSDILLEAQMIAREMYFVSRGGLAYLNQASNRVELVEVSNWCGEACLWVVWVYRGTAKAVGETHVISIDSAKLRAAVMEHNTLHTWVARCAVGYLRDLHALLDRGESVNDITRISDIEDSAYMHAISGCQSFRLPSSSEQELDCVLQAASQAPPRSPPESEISQELEDADSKKDSL